MSTERYHFLTIVGRSARQLEASCEAILARQPADLPRQSFTSVFHDYTPAVQARIDRLCRSVLDATDALPVVHHATHIDGWAMGHHGLASLPWPDGRIWAIGSMNLGLAIYPSSQADWFLAQAKRGRRRASRPGSRFWAWYASGVATAIEAGRWFKRDYTVAVLSECLGPTREDYEIDASQSALIPGLNASRGDAAVTAEYARLTRHRNPFKRELERLAERVSKTSSSGRARS